MATAVGIEDHNGIVRAIYVHSDGLKEPVLETLKKHYGTWEKAEALIALGDLSFVGKEIGEAVDFQEASRLPIYGDGAAAQCLAYSRDRGEEWEAIAPRAFTDRAQFLSDMPYWHGIEHACLLSRESLKWQCLLCDGLDPQARAIPKLVRDFEYLMDDGAGYYQAFDGFCTKWNLPCCQSCGIDELRSLRDGGEMEDQFYAFCLEHDVQGINERGRCCLSYGSFDPDTDTTDVGHRLVSALRSIGFVVEWDGDTNHRITVRLDRFAPVTGAAT